MAESTNCEFATDRVGTPRGLQGRLAAAIAIVVALWTRVEDLWITIGGQPVDPRHAFTPSHRLELLPVAR